MLTQEVICGMQQWPDVFLGIDLVELTIPQNSNTDDIIPPYELQSLIANWSSKKDKSITIKFHTPKNGYTGVTGKFPNSDGKNILVVTVGCMWGHRTAKYSFNPSKLTNADWEQIREVLWGHFNNGVHDLFKYGRIKRLEVYVDLLNVQKASTVTLSTHSH